MKFNFKFLLLVVILLTIITSCSKNEPGPVPNDNGCFPVNVEPCTASGSITNDPVKAYDFLIGTWEWQSSYYNYSTFYYDEIVPYPDGCNMTLMFNGDMTFELTVGTGRKESGYYVVDEEDITLSDQVALYFGGPNVVHQFKMHLSLSPNPSITEQSNPTSVIQGFTLSGLLSVSQSCLTLSHWSRDRHGLETTKGNRFVKK